MWIANSPLLARFRYFGFLSCVEVPILFCKDDYVRCKIRRERPLIRRDTTPSTPLSISRCLGVDPSAFQTPYFPSPPRLIVSLDGANNIPRSAQSELLQTEGIPFTGVVSRLNTRGFQPARLWKISRDTLRIPRSSETIQRSSHGT